MIAASVATINGLSFDLADRHAAEDQARLAATKALQQKLNLYAQALGLHVSRLESFSEGAGADEFAFPPSPMVQARPAVAEDAAPPTTVEPGDVTVRVTVNAVYEMKP